MAGYAESACGGVTSQGDSRGCSRKNEASSFHYKLYNVLVFNHIHLFSTQISLFHGNHLHRVYVGYAIKHAPFNRFIPYQYGYPFQSQSVKTPSTCEPERTHQDPLLSALGSLT